MQSISLILTTSMYLSPLMKQAFHLTVFLTCLFLGNGCNSNTHSTPEEARIPKNEKKEKPVSTGQDSLTATQLKDIETIHATFTEVYPISLNETIKNFRNNQDSGREIEIWLKMVETYKGLIKDGQYPKLQQRQEVFSVILASTMMPLGTLKDKVEFIELSESEVDKIYEQFMNKFKPN